MYTGKNILILGLSKSGTSAAHILRKYGAKVTVNEIKDFTFFKDEINTLTSQGVHVVTGYCDDSLVNERLDLIVKNPGIPYRQSQIQKGIKLGIPVVTEVEIGYTLSKHPIIGITGTNGKTTTTMLVQDMFQNQGVPSALAGNIGTPLMEQVDTKDEKTHLITELSSFQLMGIQTFRPHVGCLLNISEAHQDYHAHMNEYREAKLGIFKHQTMEDYAILPWEERSLSLTAKTYYFSAVDEVSAGVMIKNHTFVFKEKNGEEIEVCKVSDLRLPGKHNQENAAAAIGIALLSGISIEAITQTLKTFTGAEHRLEWVGEERGINYYNDSKATNPLAAKTALNAFQSPVIHIAGGKERGESWDSLGEDYKQRVKSCIFLGETKHKLEWFAKKNGVKEVYIVSTMEEAVRKAKEIAKQGDTVLLSPACASWDQYDSFEKRGMDFKNEVKRSVN